jgi:hypothetical protein
MKNNKTITFVILFAVLVLPVNIKASESNGTIDTGNKNGLVCHSVDCLTPTPGVINFKLTGTTPVTIDDTNGIDGVAWGNEIGWINFDPTGPEGLTINPNTGIISGKAWSQVSGWINFSATGQSVKINNSGEFEGWAWTGGPYGGWIKFDCSFAGACVKTDWRPMGARTVVYTSGAGSPGSTVSNDSCPNLVGYQENIPPNYKKDEGGLCLLNVDYCNNIEGVQLTIPSSYILNGSGQCILLTEENKDEFIPTFVFNNASVTESQPIDYCPNFFGLQSRLPDGFVKNISDCFPKDVDYCPNILGNQYSIPDNMKINNEGECLKMTKKEIIENNSNIVNIPVKISSLSKIFGENKLINLISVFFGLIFLILLIIFIKKRFKI